MPSDRPLRFGEYLLDPANARLVRGAEPVRLTPKAFDVLAFLAGRAGQLVTKEELLGGVWDDALVTDASLAVCVREVRKALADDAQNPRYIATVHRRGYRFVAEVTAAAPSLTPKPPPSGPLRAADPVGRGAELAALRGRLDRATAGRRQVVFVSGPPGSGKTAVVDALVREAVGRGVPVAAGQCFEQFGAGEAYLPVLEAVARLGRQPGAGALPGLVATHAPTWAAQLPWARAGADGPPPGATPERMLREMADLLEAFTADVPLVLVLEDLHWADRATTDLVAALARRPGPARLLVVGTFRPVDLILADHPLRRAKQELDVRRLAVELPLDPLGPDDVAEYLRDRFAAPPAPGFARQVHRRTDGHPLFVVNLADHLADHGAVVHDPAGRTVGLRPGFDLTTAVPDAVRPMIAFQVDRLTADQQRVLEAATAGGVEFCAATAAAALGAEVVDAEQACDELARRHQFLTALDPAEWPDGTIAARYRFRHELYYQVLAERVPAARRARDHQRITDRLEAAYAGRLTDVAARLAYHAEHGPDHPRAVRHLRLAAAGATGRFAHREAAEYLCRAVARAERLPEPDRRVSRVELLEALGLSRRAGGDPEAAAVAFDQMAVAARDDDRPDDEVRALFHLASAASWFDRERCLTASDAAVQAAGRATDQTLPARAAGWAGYWNLMWRGWTDDDATAAERAVAAARAASPEAATAHSARHAYFLALRSEYDAAAATAEAAAAAALRAGDGFDHLLAEFYRAWALLHRGRWAELRAVLAAAIATAGRNGHRRWERLFRLYACWLHLEAGDPPAADVAWAEAEAVADDGPFPFGDLMAGVLRGRTLLALGQVDEALAGLDGWADRLDGGRMLMDWVWRMPLHLARGECRLTAGRPADARRDADRVCESAAGPGERTYLALGLRLAARTASPAEAADLLHRAEAAGAASDTPLAARLM